MFKIADYFRIFMNAAGESEAAGAGGTGEPAGQPPAEQQQTSLLEGSSKPAEQDPPPEPFLAALPAEDDEEGWGNLWGKLGRPESAEGYELPIPEGDDGSFAKVSSGWMHGANLTKAQAQALATQWNEYQGQQVQALEQQKQQNVAAIRKEWGGNFDANNAVVNKAFNTLCTPALQEIIVNSGLNTHPEVAKFFLNIGQSLSEAKVINGDPPSSGPKSTAEIFYGTN